MKLVSVKPSSKADKKYTALFCLCCGESKCDDKKKKKVHFGSKGMDDYTITKDKEQRSRYLLRHKKNENWDVPDTAGSLSRWILWGPTTSRQENIRLFKKRFNLK